MFSLHNRCDQRNSVPNQAPGSAELLHKLEAKVLELWNKLSEDCHCKGEIRRQYQEAYASYKRHQAFVRSI